MKVTIIGGGIVGLATGYQLLQRFPGIQLLVLEKENGSGCHQTGNNSGVLHCGLYYRPGSLKARLAVQGIRRMVEFCERHDVRYELCGKIVVATEPEEVQRLHTLFEPPASPSCATQPRSHGKPGHRRRSHRSGEGHINSLTELLNPKERM